MDRRRALPHPSPPTGRLLGWTLGVLFLGASYLITDYLVRVQSRLEQLESNHLDETLRIQRSVYGHISDLRGAVSATAEEAQVAAQLRRRLEETELLLGDIGQAVEATTSTVERLASERANFVLEDTLARHQRELLGHWETLETKMESVQTLAAESRREVEQLESAVGGARDLGKMWNELVGPVVQLSGEASVGSGVLLRSQEDREKGGWRTYLLTAWHVVRDIQGDLSNTDMPVPVSIYAENGTVESRVARLLVFDAVLDAALLEVETDMPIACGANLPTRERLDALRIFDRVYAVGCPLGNDPIPTAGEIASVAHAVDNASYLMINAATYIGNSGGGIFDARSHELLGIFSKIYTHGTLRPTIVPHMGLVTPLSAVYDWLETEGYGQIVPSEPETASRAQVAAAPR